MFFNKCFNYDQPSLIGNLEIVRNVCGIVTLWKSFIKRSRGVVVVFELWTKVLILVLMWLVSS
jgi:hypothetical protein